MHISQDILTFLQPVDTLDRHIHLVCEQVYTHSQGLHTDLMRHPWTNKNNEFVQRIAPCRGRLNAMCMTHWTASNTKTNKAANGRQTKKWMDEDKKRWSEWRSSLDHKSGLWGQTWMLWSNIRSEKKGAENSQQLGQRRRSDCYLMHATEKATKTRESTGMKSCQQRYTGARSWKQWDHSVAILESMWVWTGSQWNPWRRGVAHMDGNISSSILSLSEGRKTSE